MHKHKKILVTLKYPPPPTLSFLPKSPFTPPAIFLSIFFLNNLLYACIKNKKMSFSNFWFQKSLRDFFAFSSANKNVHSKQSAKSHFSGKLNNEKIQDVKKNNMNF